MSETKIKKHLVPFQRLNINIIKSQYNAISLISGKVPLRIILHFELDHNKSKFESVYLIGYIEVAYNNKKEYVRINDEAFEVLSKYVGFELPMGLGNIYVPDGVRENWFDKKDHIVLEPIPYSNPHLGYSDGSSNLFPSPPAPSS